jgi:hypothetical protein
MIMQNFSSLASTQTDLDKFLTIFEENSRIFQKNSSANSKKYQIWVCNFILNLAKHVYAKFQIPSFYSDGLRHTFDHFWKKNRIFQENSLANSKKIQTWVSNCIFNLAKHVHAKFKLSSLYLDGLRLIFYLFSRKIQDFLKENLEFSKSEKSFL